MACCGCANTLNNIPAALVHRRWFNKPFHSIQLNYILTAIKLWIESILWFIIIIISQWTGDFNDNDIVELILTLLPNYYIDTPKRILSTPYTVLNLVKSIHGKSFFCCKFFYNKTCKLICKIFYVNFVSELAKKLCMNLFTPKYVYIFCLWLIRTLLCFLENKETLCEPTFLESEYMQHWYTT